MSKIVDLNEYRAHQEQARCFGAWKKRFGESYALDTRLADLSDRVVAYLATPGDNGNAAFYELILGVKGYEPGVGFYQLANEERLAVVDIHLFLADQVRFEMMRRLGWLRLPDVAQTPLIDLVREFERHRQAMRNSPPELVETHPQYTTFSQLPGRDREVFVRQLLRGALEEFNQRLT